MFLWRTECSNQVADLPRTTGPPHDRFTYGLRAPRISPSEILGQEVPRSVSPIYRSRNNMSGRSDQTLNADMLCTGSIDQPLLVVAGRHVFVQMGKRDFWQIGRAAAHRLVCTVGRMSRVRPLAPFRVHCGCTTCEELSCGRVSVDGVAA